ncbi:MAG: hypothetical protein IKP46_02590 [Bacteroidales bacterium]|nr:hypothetical protein [Bacteroidales bacterium]
MKKVIFFLAVAATVAAMSSCKEIANQLVNVPNFQMSENVYSGQSQQLHKLSLCKFSFSAEGYTDWVTIQPENEDGKVFASFFIHGATAACKEVVITAKNADDASVSPVSVKTTIHPWKLYVLKKNSEGNYEIANPDDPEQFFNAPAGDYRIQMFAMEKDNHSWNEVKSFTYSFNPAQEGSLNWGKDSAISYTAEEGTHLDFHLNGNEGEVEIFASLGEGFRTYSRNAIVNTSGI